MGLSEAQVETLETIRVLVQQEPEIGRRGFVVVIVSNIVLRFQTETGGTFATSDKKREGPVRLDR